MSNYPCEHCREESALPGLRYCLAHAYQPTTVEEAVQLKRVCRGDCVEARRALKPFAVLTLVHHPERGYRLEPKNYHSARSTLSAVSVGMTYCWCGGLLEPPAEHSRKLASR